MQKSTIFCSFSWRPRAAGSKNTQKTEILIVRAAQNIEPFFTCWKSDFWRKKDGGETHFLIIEQIQNWAKYNKNLKIRPPFKNFRNNHTSYNLLTPLK